MLIYLYLLFKYAHFMNSNLLIIITVTLNSRLPVNQLMNDLIPTHLTPRWFSKGVLKSSKNKNLDMFLNGTFDTHMVQTVNADRSPCWMLADCSTLGRNSHVMGGFSYSAFKSLGAMVQWLLISKMSGPPKSRGLRKLCVAGYRCLLRLIHRSFSRTSELNINKPLDQSNKIFKWTHYSETY